MCVKQQHVCHVYASKKTNIVLIEKYHVFVGNTYNWKEQVFCFYKMWNIDWVDRDYNLVRFYITNAQKLLEHTLRLQYWPYNCSSNFRIFRPMNAMSMDPLKALTILDECVRFFRATTPLFSPDNVHSSSATPLPCAGPCSGKSTAAMDAGSVHISLNMLVLERSLNPSVTLGFSLFQTHR